MGEYKKTCVEEDRIGNLPAHLTDSILDRLPVQEAVKTSILSRKWRYRWTTMRALVFDENFSNKFAENGAVGGNGFIRIINRVLLLHKGPILKFHLHIPKLNIDIFQEVDQWMLFLSGNGVTELILTNANRRYDLPSHVFSCVELTKLKLKNCILKRPLELERFLNLEDLYLRNIHFGDNLSGTQISLPQLKMLSLYMCTNLSSFRIKATKLQILALASTLFAIEDFVGEERKNLVRGLSHLPGIKDLRIQSIFLKLLFAENIPKWLPHPVNSLKRLRLQSFQFGDLDQLHGVLCLLRNSSNLEQLHLIMDTQVDAGPALNHLEAPNCLDCTLNQLQFVEIRYLQGSRPELLFIKLLLAHSPSLERFSIYPSGASDAQKRFDILKDITQFPRASPNAKMFFLNPWP